MVKDRLATTSRIERTGIIAVIRAASPQVVLEIAEAVMDGGVDCVEITMTVPRAIDAIKELRSRYSHEEVLVGAGTVLDATTARMCLDAGAEFIVSPHLDEEIVQLVHAYGKACMAGAMTVTEIVRAMRAGSDYVKLFPASVFGPSGVRAVLAPLPQARLCPTGGVTLENVAEWFRAGVAAVGVGGNLVGGGSGPIDASKIAAAAREFVLRIREAREEKRP